MNTTKPVETPRKGRHTKMLSDGKLNLQMPWPKVRPKVGTKTIGPDGSRLQWRQCDCGTWDWCHEDGARYQWECRQCRVVVGGFQKWWNEEIARRRREQQIANGEITVDRDQDYRRLYCFLHRRKHEQRYRVYRKLYMRGLRNGALHDRLEAELAKGEQ